MLWRSVAAASVQAVRAPQQLRLDPRAHTKQARERDMAHMRKSASNGSIAGSKANASKQHDAGSRDSASAAEPAS